MLNWWTKYNKSYFLILLNRGLRKSWESDERYECSSQKIIYLNTDSHNFHKIAYNFRVSIQSLETIHAPFIYEIKAKKALLKNNLSIIKQNEHRTILVKQHQCKKVNNLAIRD